MSLIKVQATELQQVLNTLEINNKTMAKASGGTRKLKHGSREYRKRQDEIKAMQGMVSIVLLRWVLMVAISLLKRAIHNIR